MRIHRVFPCPLTLDFSDRLSTRTFKSVEKATGNNKKKDTSGKEPKCLVKVEIDGVEPTTLCLQSRCSSQLSYIPKIW